LSQETKRVGLHRLSLIIVVLSIMLLIAFILPWIDREDEEGQRVGGITIATDNVRPTEEFLNSSLFIIPAVAISLMVQYGRTINTEIRPRRRSGTAIGVIAAIIVLAGWTRLYVINVAGEEAREEERTITTPEDFDDPELLGEILENSEGDTTPYTREDVLTDIITVNVYAMFLLLVLLLVLPFLDRRPEREPPQYLSPGKPFEG